MNSRSFKLLLLEERQRVRHMNDTDPNRTSESLNRNALFLKISKCFLIRNMKCWSFLFAIFKPGCQDTCLTYRLTSKHKSPAHVDAFY